MSVVEPFESVMLHYSQLDTLASGEKNYEKVLCI